VPAREPLGGGGIRGQICQVSLSIIVKQHSHHLPVCMLLRSPDLIKCGWVSCKGWPNAQSAAEISDRRVVRIKFGLLLNVGDGRAAALSVDRMCCLAMAITTQDPRLFNRHALHARTALHISGPVPDPADSRFGLLQDYVLSHTAPQQPTQPGGPTMPPTGGRQRLTSALA